jgi:hypothetical protein
VARRRRQCRGSSAASRPSTRRNAPQFKICWLRARVKSPQPETYEPLRPLKVSTGCQSVTLPPRGCRQGYPHGPRKISAKKNCGLARRCLANRAMRDDRLPRYASRSFLHPEPPASFSSTLALGISLVLHRRSRGSPGKRSWSTQIPAERLHFGVLPIHLQTSVLSGCGASAAGGRRFEPPATCPPRSDCRPAGG